MTNAPKLRDYDRASLALQAEPLKTKLKRLEKDMSDADWENDERRIVALDYEIRMTKLKLSIGETHDAAF